MLVTAQKKRKKKGNHLLWFTLPLSFTHHERLLLRHGHVQRIAVVRDVGIVNGKLRLVLDKALAPILFVKPALRSGLHLNEEFSLKVG